MLRVGVVFVASPRRVCCPVAASRRPAGCWGAAPGGCVAGLQLLPVDCNHLGSCCPARLAKAAVLKVSNWFRWVRDVIDEYRTDVETMDDDFVASSTPPFLTESLEMAMQVENENSKPPCFSCAFDNQNGGRSFSAESYLASGSLKRVLLRLDPSPNDYEEDVVEMFGFQWVTEMALVESCGLLFGLLRLEKTFKIIESNRNLTLPRPPLYHVPKHLIQTSFKYLQGWQLNHFPGQPVPMLDNPFSEVKFPNIQSKPPLVQLEAISSRPMACYLGEETDIPLATTSFQVVAESDKVSPQPPLLQAKQPQLPQPLLIRLLLQTLHQLHCPSLDTVQHLNVPLVVGGPKLNTVFEGHNHFPTPAGHTIFDTSQDAIGLLGHLGTLLAHVQLAVNQHPQVLFCLAAFQPLFPKPVALHGVAVAQVQDLALGLVKPHTVDLSPSIQPVQVPLQSLPTLKQINTPAQLGVICKLTEGALDPFIQIIDKDIKQNWPQHRALGNTTCDWPPTGVNSIHHHSLGLAIQPVLNPAKSTPVQAMSSQFLQENAVGNSVKGFTEV
ncbi:hypothetical protein QYF61_025643 [Mycteria americana]|uniref:Protein MMS22-like N-terminal domain-containing protein n=1 Tax=Mycteria americana TaxID=33587 RepID=A0AAN7RYD3_MYCAM|nr:hypothetical protein QYF61_025643 [Mycteria americana]